MIDLSHIEKTDIPMALIISPSMVAKLCIVFNENKIPYNFCYALKALDEKLVKDTKPRSLRDTIVPLWPDIFTNKEKYPESYHDYKNRELYTDPEDNILFTAKINMNKVRDMLAEIYNDKDVFQKQIELGNVSLQRHETASAMTNGSIIS